MTALEFNYHLTGLSDKLKGFAFSLTNNQEDAKDLFQETLLRAFRYRDKYASETNLKAWVYTIMKNIFINQYRRQVKVRMIHDDSDSSFLLNQHKSKNPDVLSQMSFDEIQSLINNLDPFVQIPFKQYLDGYKYKEISDELNIPIGTVKSRIFTARKALMQQLQNRTYA